MKRQKYRPPAKPSAKSIRLYREALYGGVIPSAVPQRAPLEPPTEPHTADILRDWTDADNS